MQEQAKKKKKIKVTRTIDGVEREVEIEVDDTGVAATWGPNDKHTLLNKRLPRVDAPLKVTGTAEYSYDKRLPGMLHGRIVRSPHARARVTKFDPSPALRIPGVKTVVEARAPKEQVKEIRYQGEPVAAVAATTPEIAADAVRAILVEYEVLPHVVKAEQAVKDDAPKVFPEGNIEPKATQGDAKRVAALLEKCDAVVEADYKTPIIHHACLETHGMVIDYRGGDSATVYASTQGTFTIPADSAQELGLPQSAVTSVVEHMGGGFGSKFGIGVEGKLGFQL